MKASSGTVSATATQKRRRMSSSSGLASERVISRGSSAMPQMGQAPGSERTICGCMGQVYSVRVAGAARVAGSSAMPHLGQAPGPSFETSGSMGQMYSVASSACVAGSAVNLASHDLPQK